MSSYQQYHDEERRINTVILGDLFRPPINSVVANELERLLKSYGTNFRLGKAHPAPCSAWRAERDLQDPSQDSNMRFANRVHVFAGARHRVGSSQEDKTFLTQRYLGYVSLRPTLLTSSSDTSNQEYLKYTSEAMLIVPPYMTRPRFHVITCHAGPADGVLPFRSTPFFNPASGDGALSAPCIHVSLHSALLLKSGIYHCRPISSLEMATLLWQMDRDPNWPEPVRLPDDTRTDMSFGEWRQEGLSLEQALKVLRHPRTRAGGIVERVTGSTAFSRTMKPKDQVALEALRCLTDYVANGIPILVEINAPKDPENEAEMGHAILLIGFRLMVDPYDDRGPIPDDEDPVMERIDVKELPSRFIVHDSYRGPYSTVSSSALLKVARITRKKETDGFRFLPILPVKAKIGIQQVREYTAIRLGQRRIRNSSYLTEQLGYPPGSTEPSSAWDWLSKPSEARFITRLMRARQIIHRYLRYGSTARSLRKPELERFFQRHQEAYDASITSDLESESVDPIGLHWWCVEVRAPIQPKMAHLKKVRGKGGRNVPPFAVYLWPINMDHEKAFASPVVRIEYESAGGVYKTEGTEYETAGSGRLIAVDEAGELEFQFLIPRWRPQDG